MMKSGYRVFALNEAEDLNLLFKRIEADFSRSEETADPVNEVYLDTFDWRIFSGGRVFRQSGPLCHLGPLYGTSPVVEISAPEKDKLFWWDFPEGAVRDTLQSLLGVRALCPLFRLVGSRMQFNLCNRDDKTILRMSLAKGEIIADGESKGMLPPVLHLMEIRGYRKPFRRVTELLQAGGLLEPASGAGLLELALGVIGRKPGDYSSKFSVVLDQEQTLNRAVSTIGLELHRAMKRNLPGVLEDIDSEFLHDIRVAIRRTRSVLSQLKMVIPPGQRRFFSQEFKWLGSVTGPVRDIDVCLKKEGVFRGLLPESMQSGMDLLMEEIRRRRGVELVKMQEDLRSTRTADLFGNWQDFLLALPDDIQWTAGQIPCRTAALKIVATCLQRLLRYAESVMNGEDGDAAMHRLRIQGKKFRYLMEFFRSLFPEATTVKLLGELKELQDEFGDFNDLAIQLRRFQRDFKTIARKRQAGDSLTGLIEGLGILKKRSRKRCLLRCKKFMDKENEDPLVKAFREETGD